MDDLVVRVEMTTDAELPAYGYPGDAGMDLAVVGEVTLYPGESKDLPTGIKVELPEGVWGRITGRSSTMRKRGLFVNEGVIDQGYRGELFVYVTNRNAIPVIIEHGTRLAQLILAPVLRALVVEVEQVGDSARGVNGFGSTGHTFWTPIAEGELPGGPIDIGAVLDHMFPESVVMVMDSKPTEGVTEAERHTDAPTSPAGHGDTTESLPRATGTVYLGGPIDHHGEHPEERHRRFTLACQMYGGGAGPRPFFDVYCPACRKRVDESPAETISRNNAENSGRDWGVFEFDARGDVSFGTPIEIWERWTDGSPIIIVGNLGEGLFGQLLRQGGVVEVANMAEAVKMIVDGPG